MMHPLPGPWEEQIQQTARGLVYPPTPDIAGQVAEQLGRPRSRRLHPAWALLVILALLAGLWATPAVRAAIREFLQIGGVRIWLVEPTPAPSTATPVTSLFALFGETTLAGAAEQAGFPIHLPAYPPGLGPPDGVFFQELGGPVVVLVWLDPQHPQAARLSLHILGKGAFVNKGQPAVVTTTKVNGKEAAWTTGPYMLSYRQGRGQEWDLRRLVQSGHVLVWAEDGLTYRLESDLSLA
ncbi:MAG TPA: hypothetical protein PKE45_15490, partial [Caldilineaceae bacterium]|nr:hypothetical protein [Caldilineaceae bacterium]